VDKGLSQSDLERTSGLLRCYISRVEHGHTVPSVPTLERMASGLEIPMYRLFYEGDEDLIPPKIKRTYPSEWGSSGADAEFFRKFRAYVGQTSPRNRKLLLAMAYHLARETESRATMGRNGLRRTRKREGKIHGQLTTSEG
jgi:transcriptional regulator with XRE-family HTH domain